MIPYIYSYAHIAQATGIPMVRPMFLEDQNNETAWQKDLQYFWGKEMLVAPNCSDGGNTVSVWLPKGNWYDFWTDKSYGGDKTESIPAATGVVPAFVKAGAIIPMAPFAKSTFFIPKDVLLIHVYTGADGSFRLYEDDGVTEKYRTKNELRTTDLRYAEQDLGLEVSAAHGTFTGAADSRSYQIVYHGLAASTSLHVNTSALATVATPPSFPASQDGVVWDSDKKLLHVFLAARPVNAAFRVGTASGMPSAGGAGGSVRGGAGGSVSGGTGGSVNGGAGGSVNGGAGGRDGGSGSGGVGGHPIGGSGGNATGGVSVSQNGGAGGSTSGGNRGGSGASASTSNSGTASGCSCHIGDVHRPSGRLLLMGIALAVVGFHRTRKISKGRS
jgi:hypothetical protein